MFDTRLHQRVLFRVFHLNFCLCGCLCVWLFSGVTAIEMKKTMRKLKLTKYMENLYYILFAVTGNNHLA